MTNPTACRDLKPCPFCHGDGELDIDENRNHFVSCIGCRAEGYRAACATDAANAWNTRVPEGDAVADVTPLSDVTLLRNLCEDMDMHPTVREQLRSLAKRIEQGAQTVVTHCRRCGEHAEVTVHSTHPRATSAEVERMRALEILKSVHGKAQSMFEEYVRVNYPDGCVIARASWHAPRLFRNAIYAIDAAIADLGEAK